jgi:hypothetical protein
MTRAFVFSSTDFRKLARAFGSSPIVDKACARFQVGSVERRLVLEIYSGIKIGKTRGSLISVFTRDSHLQLHFCTGYVVSRSMGEVTFVGEKDGKLSGLIIEKSGGCSFYANVDRALLSGDYTHLGPEVMLSGIALSMTDTILDEGKPSLIRSRRGPRRK